jgi:S-adenosylmethionine:diacylglycerol 3-amino-3-carboxypropyl transferase
MHKERKEAGMTNDAPMYKYATENVSGYYSKLNLKGKKVLTIVGSGDQILNAYYFGAKKVAGFDINIHSKHITLLKIAAIQHLLYQEFLTFFGKNHSSGAFSHSVYLKLRKSLDKETKRFFDKVYKENKNDGKKVLSSNYFRQRKMRDVQLVLTANEYLKSSKKYDKMKEVLESKKLFFKKASFSNIGNKLKKEKFDLINLSNTQNYYGLKLKNPFNKLGKVLIKLQKNLSKNGKIFFCTYSLSNYPNKVAKVTPEKMKKRQEELLETIRATGKFKISQKKFKGIKKGKLDTITILEKK